MSSKISLKPQSIRCHGNIVTSKNLDDFQSFNCNLEKEEETGVYIIKNDDVSFNRLELSTDKQIVDVLRDDKANLTVQLINNQGQPVRLADVYVTLYITYAGGEVDVYSSDYTDENGCVTFIYSAQNNFNVNFQAKSNTKISNTIFISDMLYHSFDEEIYEFSGESHIDILNGKTFSNLTNWSVKMDVSMSSLGAINVEPGIGTTTRLVILRRNADGPITNEIPKYSYSVGEYKDFKNNWIWNNDAYYTIAIQKRGDDIIFMFMNESVTVSLPQVSNWGDLHVDIYSPGNNIMKIRNFTIW